MTKIHSSVAVIYRRLSVSCVPVLVSPSDEQKVPVPVPGESNLEYHGLSPM